MCLSVCLFACVYIFACSFIFCLFMSVHFLWFNTKLREKKKERRKKRGGSTCSTYISDVIISFSKDSTELFNEFKVI